MSTNPTIKDLLERSKQIASNHKPLPYLSERRSLGQQPPKTLIITCADGRNVPEVYLGLKSQDAAVIRNVCGHVGPALNDIVCLDHLLGLQQVMVIHHTDCGTLRYTDAEVRETLKARMPNNEAIDSMEFGAITDIEQSVRDDLAILKKAPLVRKQLAESSCGFVFDIKTGLLTSVEA